MVERGKGSGNDKRGNSLDGNGEEVKKKKSGLRERFGVGSRGSKVALLLAFIIVLYSFVDLKIPTIFDKGVGNRVDNFIEDMSHLGDKDKYYSIYNKRQISGSEVWNKSDSRYYVYVYSGVEGLDEEFNDAILKYDKNLLNGIEVYRIHKDDFYGDVVAPVILEMIGVEGGESLELMRYGIVDYWLESME